MSVTVEKMCQLCGEPLSPFEGIVHGICGIDENARYDSQPKATGQPCHLCGKPIMPFERGVHNECAMLENMRNN